MATTSGLVVGGYIKANGIILMNVVVVLWTISCIVLSNSMTSFVVVVAVAALRVLL